MTRTGTSRPSVAVLVILAVIATCRFNMVQAEAVKTPPCSAPEYHQFDFWVGDWNAYDFDNPNIVVAHNRVSLILDGCVLLEDYQGTNGHKGQSFTMYDATRKVWHQSWVTNRGELLVIEGKLQDGQMVMSGTDKTADGAARVVRGFWKAVPDGVRETADTSLDGGKTWKPWFDLVFRPTSALPASAK